MAYSRQKTKTAKIQNSNLFTFFATLSGVMVGVLASLAMVGPMVRSEVASATRTLQARPVSSVTECVSPNDEGGASNTAKVKTAATTKPGGGSGGGGGGSTEVIKKIINSNTTVAGMSNTGPGSENSITTINRNTTTIENNNNVSVENSNSQSATSGDARVSGNTNAGSAASGKATNTNQTSTDISISN